MLTRLIVIISTTYTNTESCCTHETNVTCQLASKEFLNKKQKYKQLFKKKPIFSILQGYMIFLLSTHDLKPKILMF